MRDRIFPGVRPASIDFQAVRDGRRSLPLQFEISLAAARSLANGVTSDITDATGKALQLNIAGNIFYCDPLIDSAGVAIGGVAVAHFQDTALSAGLATSLTILPGGKHLIPFTTVTIENPAQAGKRLRVAYGVDIDLNAGFNAYDVSDRASRLLGVVYGDSQPLRQVTVVNSGLVQGPSSAVLVTRDMGYAYGSGVLGNTLLGALGTLGVFTSAANTNGAIVWSAEIASSSAAANSLALVAKVGAAAPGSIGDGDPLLTAACLAGGLATARLERAVFVAAGKGVWFISTAAEATITVKDAKYSLL